MNFCFVEFFLNLLEMGQRELDVMFSTAYGLQYKQNQDVFNQLFANFQRYYKGGDISLNDAMNTVSIVLVTVTMTLNFALETQYALQTRNTLNSFQCFWKDFVIGLNSLV